MKNMNKTIEICTDNIKSTMQEKFKSCKVEIDMIYDDAEDYYHFVFLVDEDFEKKRDLQDFLNENFLIISEDQRKHLYLSGKFPFIFEMDGNGLEILKKKISI